MSGEHQITRERILEGAVEERLQEAEKAGLFTRLPEEIRVAEMHRVHGEMPPGDVWVFGYGSLIWNPAFHYAEKRRGRIHGYHRRFCLETPLGRGSPDCPGLVLGLDSGGSCHGIAFRLPPENALHELDIVFRRELVGDAYRARTVRVHTSEGVVRAATFVINRKSERYCGVRTPEEEAQMIAKAAGWLGPCSDYLLNTVDHLKELGMNDRALYRLADRVRAIQAAA
ncbi:MAG: gamma-glutamylcyclotransferase [Minwuia sp.]|uniref:gamma-glutamylcyclotransferase n=1 Tax=Minwuia sp. TaxID=2493630 RepID=UPI003A853EA2